MGNDDTVRVGVSGRRPWTVRRFVALLVVAFTAHNVEELLRNEAHVAALTGGGPLGWWIDEYRTDRFVVAVVVLTVGVVALLLPAARRPGRTTARAALVGTGALLGNAVSHVVQAGVLGGYNPGLLTAVVLVAPIGALLARALVAWSATRPCASAGLLVTGAVLAVPAIVGALLLSTLVVG